MPQVPREWTAVGAFGRPTERAARARSGGIPFRFNPVSAGRAGRSGTPVFCGRGVASARLRPSCGPVAQLDVTPIGPGYAPCCRIVPDTPPQPAVTEQPGRRRWAARVLAVLAVLGPGLITANAENDAGGILTYGEGQPAARARRVRAAFPLRRRQALLRHRAHRRWSNRPQPTRGGVERTRRRCGRRRQRGRASDDSARAGRARRKPHPGRRRAAGLTRTCQPRFPPGENGRLSGKLR